MFIDSNKLYNSKRAGERRSRSLKFIAILLVACVVSYKFGFDSVRSREEAYKEQLQTLQKDRQGIEAIITSLRTELQLSKLKYDQIKEKYDADIPQGEVKKLSKLIEKQLESGIQADRLYYLIKSSSPPRNCSVPITKNFVMKTPAYKGPHGDISFADGIISISGEGKSAVNSSGKPEAWYDPGQPVEITFKRRGQSDITVKRGLLPIYHSIVIANKEHRFTISAGERSFITATSDNCDYP